MWFPNSQPLRGACCWQSCQQGEKKNARLSNRNKSWRVFCQAIQAFIHLLLHAEYWGGKEKEGGEMSKRRAEGGLNSLPPCLASPFPSEGPAWDVYAIFSFLVYFLSDFFRFTLAAGGLQAKGEQRDLNVLWAWGLKAVLDMSSNPIKKASSAICKFAMVPLCCLDLFLDPTWILNMLSWNTWNT